MSWLVAAGNDATGAVDLMVEPGVKDLGGGFRVRRALPTVKRRMVGPFIFLDQMGPTTFDPGAGLDVRPHPHIGLATLTYLFEGTIYHRDTLGSALEIAPGDVNWMTAGRGIAHSERSDATSRLTARTLTGLQSWVALPQAHEETQPSFFHHATDVLPELADTGVRVRLVAGTAYGATSPVATFQSMVYADAKLVAGAALPLPDEHAERAVYVLEGSIEIAGETFGANRLLVFRPGDRVTMKALLPTRLMILGGEPMDGPRYIWWNFVHSSNERIEQAKADWRAGRFGVVPGDEREFIPLPA